MRLCSYGGGMGAIEPCTVLEFTQLMDARMKCIEAWNNAEWVSWHCHDDICMDPQRKDGPYGIMPWNDQWLILGTVGQGVESPIVNLIITDENRVAWPLLSVKLWGYDNALLVLNALLLNAWGWGDWSWVNNEALVPLEAHVRAEYSKIENTKQ